MKMNNNTTSLDHLGKQLSEWRRTGDITQYLELSAAQVDAILDVLDHNERSIDDLSSRIITKDDTIRMLQLTIEQQGKWGAPGERHNAQATGSGPAFGPAFDVPTGSIHYVGEMTLGAATVAAPDDRDRAYITVTECVGDVERSTSADFDFLHTADSQQNLGEAIAAFRRVDNEVEPAQTRHVVNISHAPDGIAKMVKEAVEASMNKPGCGRVTS